MNAPVNLPPSRPIASIEAEQALLGAIMVNNEAFGAVADILRPDDFYEPFHRTVYELMARQISDGRLVTPITLRASLPEAELATGMTTTKYLVQLATEATTIIGARDYGRAVRDTHIARQIAAVGDELRASPEMALSTGEGLVEAWKRLDKLRQLSQESEDRSSSIGESAQRMAERITELRNGGAARFVSTGLAEYDRAIGGGYRRGRLYIQAGRPGMGKTVVAIACARRIARSEHAVKFYSLEIDHEETAARTIAAELARSSTPLSYGNILTGNVDDHQHQRIAEAALRMQEWPLRYDCSGRLSMAQIEARTRIDKERMAKAGKELDVVFIDYLGMINLDRQNRNRNDTLEIGDVVLSAKTMAKELDIAVILLGQLNRGVEGRDDKRPTMADLRQSGNIEEHADCVALQYRPAYYLEKSPKFKGGDPESIEEMELVKNNLELIIDKNRLGPTGTRHFWCDVAVNAVEDKARP
jgi:replicative DNA helicase